MLNDTIEAIIVRADSNWNIRHCFEFFEIMAQQDPYLMKRANVHQLFVMQGNIVLFNSHSII
jgi:hypothetical protein